MLEKTKGILLKQTKFSDSQVIAEIYTEKYGRQAFIIRHSKKNKNLPQKNILQSLFLLEMQIYYKQKREVQKVKEINHKPILTDLPFNFNKSSIALFIAEVLYKVIKEQEANKKLFSFLHNSILLLDNLENGIGNYHIIFLYELSKYLGFYPENNYSNQNKYFSLFEGRFYNIKIDNNIFLDEQTSKIISFMHSKGFSTINDFNFSKIQRNLFLKALIKYYHFQLPEMGKIKSLEILQEVFS